MSLRNSPELALNCYAVKGRTTSVPLLYRGNLFLGSSEWLGFTYHHCYLFGNDWIVVGNMKVITQHQLQSMLARR